MQKPRRCRRGQRRKRGLLFEIFRLGQRGDVVFRHALVVDDAGPVEAEGEAVGIAVGVHIGFRVARDVFHLRFDGGHILGHHDGQQAGGLVIAGGNFEEQGLVNTEAAMKTHTYILLNEDATKSYLDGKVKGGGEICALRINELGSDPIVIKTVYTGQPELRLDGHYISWIERTGTNRDKLFVCDLETQETTVVDMFTNSSYGTSAPYMHDGTLIWAAEGTEHFDDGRISSVIKHIDIESSGIRDYLIETYVHDPKTNGRWFAWLNAHHSANTTLFAAKAEGDSMLEPSVVADGVVDFAIDEEYLVYSVDEVIYVYFFNNGQSYRITPERELAQLLGASEGYVIWMDVTTRQRDVLKIARIPVN